MYAFSASWWRQNSEDCLFLQGNWATTFPPGLSRACVLVDYVHAHTRPGGWRTILGTRAKGEGKGLIPLPRSFTFLRKQGLPTSDSLNHKSEL